MWALMRFAASRWLMAQCALQEHIAVYGTDNDLRLTGAHETGHISQFSSGVANRYGREIAVQYIILMILFWFVQRC